MCRNTHFYVELKIHNAALLLVAVVSATGWLPPPAKLTPRRQAVCRCFLCFAMRGAALTMAGIDFAEAQAETESNPHQNFQP